jgi:D-glycero-D-manno-heptose 1,7-bisphosphate phosphatase
MEKPAIFLDRDNTLIECDGYLSDPAGVKLIGGAAEAVARARAMGFAVVVISNQSGVGRGMFTEEAVVAVNQRMDALLRQENPGAIIDHHEFCPFHPEAKIEKYRQESDLRKPKPGMIFRAATALDLDPNASWVIGDAARDIEAGHAAGCRTILVLDPSLPPSPAALQPSRVDPDETVSSLAEAMDIIEAAGGAAPPDEPPPAKLAAQLDQTHRRFQAGSASPPNPIEPPKPASATQPTARAAQSIVKPPHPDPLHMPATDLSKLEELTGQILEQLRGPQRLGRQFYFSKLLAGLLQALTLAIAAGSFFYRPANDPNLLLLIAVFLQLFTIALLLMSQDADD